MMTIKIKAVPQEMGNGSNQNSMPANKNNETNNNISKAPTKMEACIEAFTRRKSLNTFEANKEYGDTCLHTSVSDLQKKHGIVIGRTKEKTVNRVGRSVVVTRYTLLDIEQMKSVLTDLKKARGL